MDSGICFWQPEPGAPGAGIDAPAWTELAVARWMRAARLRRDCMWRFKSACLPRCHRWRRLSDQGGSCVPAINGSSSVYPAPANA